MAWPWPEEIQGQAKCCLRQSFWFSLAWPILAQLGQLFGLRLGWNNTNNKVHENLL